MSWLALVFASGTVLSTFAGGLLGLRLAHSLPAAIALTGGVVVAIALFDILPEAIEAVDDPHRVGGLVALGFLAFFLAERALVLHHRDEADQARATTTLARSGRPASLPTASSTGSASVSRSGWTPRPESSSSSLSSPMTLRTG